MDLTVEQIKTYREDGFLIVEDYIPPDRVEVLRDRLDRLFEGEYQSVLLPDEHIWKKGRDDPALTRQIGNIWKCDPDVAEDAFSEQLGRHVAQLHDVDSVRLLQDMAIVKPPHAKALSVHQDGPYASFLDPLQFTTVWSTLDDTAEGAGNLAYVRGSHKWGKFPAVSFHNPDDWMAEFEAIAPDSAEIEFVPIVVKAGTVVFHSPWIWHASGPSGRGDVVRRTYIRVLIPGDTRHHPRIRNRFYSRYFGEGEYEFDERFFPIVWSADGYRSPWMERHIEAMKTDPPVDAYSSKALDLAEVLDRTW